MKYSQLACKENPLQNKKAKLLPTHSSVKKQLSSNQANLSILASLTVQKNCPSPLN